MSGSRVLTRVRWLRWPIGVGLPLYTYKLYTDTLPTQQWPQWKVRVYSSLPLRSFSAAFGYMSECHIPVCLRRPLLGLYARLYDCDLNEAQQSDIKQYATLSELFGRTLRPEYRPISQSHMVVPCDSVLYACGPVTGTGDIDHVKGIAFHVQSFLGDTPNTEKCASNRLFYCSFYLAPGDYHGFHSPVHWKLQTRRHFPGLLLSVRPSIMSAIPSLLNVNERVAVLGVWQHGFYSMTAVAATNVGNIHIDPDHALDKINADSQPTRQGEHIEQEHRKGNAGSQSMDYCTRTWSDVVLEKGSRLGEFRLGSSIVLVFEAPNDFEFVVKPGQKVKYGQTLGLMGDGSRLK